MTKFRAFLCSVLITLFCLVPIYLIVLGGQLFGSTSADTPAEGVSTVHAAPEDNLRLLLIVKTPTPVFAVVLLDAYTRKAECRILPPCTVVLQNGSPTTLQDCWASAGPLQVQECLTETVGGGCERYLEISSEALAELFGEFSPVFSWDELGRIRDLSMLRRFAYNGGEGAISSISALFLLRASTLAEPEQSALRAGVYAAFLQDGLTALAEPVNELLRSKEDFSTDITAVDIYGVCRLFQLLAQAPPTVHSRVPDGRMTAGRYELSAAGATDLSAILIADAVS